VGQTRPYSKEAGPQNLKIVHTRDLYAPAVVARVTEFGRTYHDQLAIDQTENFSLLGVNTRPTQGAGDPRAHNFETSHSHAKTVEQNLTL